MLKSNIAWMKKNVPSDLKVWKGMIQDIDWQQVAAKTKLSSRNSPPWTPAPRSIGS